MRIRATAFLLLLAGVSAGLGTGVAVAQPSASARAELDRAGDRLQLVTEQYNAARLRRSNLDGELAQARGGLNQAESKLAEGRDQLGVAVRELYMHRGAHIGEFFTAKSLSDLQRGRALTGRVVLSTDTLILQVRRARAEHATARGRLESLRDQAREDELAIAARRDEAAAALRRAQSLVRQIGEPTLERERREEVAAADDVAKERVNFAGPVRPSAAIAVRAAASQIGKPYRWGAAGPDSYDCSGLTMWAWAKAGVSLPHSSQAQYASLPHVPLSEIAPGDLLFSGSPIHHVGIYKGGGVVINAPHTGANVRENSAFRSDLVGAARP